MENKIKVVNFSETGWVEWMSIHVDEISFEEVAERYGRCEIKTMEDPKVLYISDESVFEVFVGLNSLSEELQEEVLKIVDGDYDYLDPYKDWMRDEEIYETEEEDRYYYFENFLSNYIENLFDRVVEYLKLEI